MRSTLTWLGAAPVLIVAWSGAAGALMVPAGAATRPAPAGGWSDQNVPLPPHAKFAGPGAVSCPSASDCVLVGSYSKPGIYGFLLAEGWNGRAWANERIPSLPGGGADLNGVSCVAAGHCLAVGGSFDNEMLSAQLDGSTWTTQTAFPLPSGASGGSLAAVWCASMSDCTAVGEYGLAASGNDLPVVSCPSAADCTAVGGYWSKQPEEGYALAEQWNGSAWTIQAAPDPSIGADELNDIFQVPLAQHN
jgi:hypothetical protein